MVIITAFQAEDLGSIPSVRSKTHTIMKVYFDTEFTSLSMDANLISASLINDTENIALIEQVLCLFIQIRNK